ncbi:MAG: pantothenate kinase, partial [Longispora sp.]|nr:pantothenate kinase [Longispora sp. (in: high G+C Gram-positive bacteria)]
VYGFAAQVDGMVDRIMAELGGSVTAVIATGGLAPVVLDECETITHHEPFLTLTGLRLVWERTR